MQLFQYSESSTELYKRARSLKLYEEPHSDTLAYILGYGVSILALGGAIALMCFQPELIPFSLEAIKWAVGIGISSGTAISSFTYTLNQHISHQPFDYKVWIKNICLASFAATIAAPISIYGFSAVAAGGLTGMAAFKGNNNQSHNMYIEVAQGDIFMEQKMRFGLVLGQLAILKKKIGPIMIMSNF